MTDPAGAKDVLRRAALRRRLAAQGAWTGDPARLLRDVLAEHRGRVVAGYAPIRSEIDPTSAMKAMAAHGPVCLPVIEAPARPLRFRAWTPGCAMEAGPFGARVPAAGDWLVPEVLIVPLVAFDRQGGRLGYGGGYYDRTLAGLRAAGPVTAIGFAWAVQEEAAIPAEETDAPLDLVVTERETIAVRGPGPA